MFGDYLLLDDESNRLFKKTLALLDAPNNDYSDFKRLIELQLSKVTDMKGGRVLKKLFATFNLLSSIIIQYSHENKNLHAAKECLAYVCLRTWSWILKNKNERRPSLQNEFRKLLQTHFRVLKAYFDKTLPVAIIDDGLYSDQGGPFEAIGYPLRCFDYTDDLIYFYNLSIYESGLKESSVDYARMKNDQKDVLINLIENNSGFKRPLIDNHSISILNIFLFFADDKSRRQKDVDFLAFFIFEIINGLIIIKRTRGRIPEGFSRVKLVCEFEANRVKPDEYVDSSSILLAVLLELLVILDNRETYLSIKNNFPDIDFQIPILNTKEFDDIEERLFSYHLGDEFYIEKYEGLPDDFEEFKKLVKAKDRQKFELRTDNAGFPFLKYLAHTYFKNEWTTYEWRRYLKA